MADHVRNETPLEPDSPTTPAASLEGRSLVVFGLLCVPGLVGASAVALDNVTWRLFGSTLSTWGFSGGVVGLAGLLSGLLSIFLWPVVASLTFGSVRGGKLGLGRLLCVVAGCLVATYSGVYFSVWFVVIPLLQAAWD
jgi:hypothetical protein